MHFEFIETRKYWFLLSLIVVLIALGALVFKGLNFSLEFTGGTSITWKFDKAVKVEQIRGEMGKFGLGGAKSIIQPVGKAGQHEFIIRTEPLPANTDRPNDQTEVLQGLQQDLGGERVSVLTVGPAWGKQVTQAAVVALILSLAAILLYLSIRFEYKMAVTAVGALFHDITIAVGVYALVGREVSPATIAAFLTILGYSLYDTIVVFHRILENSRKMGKVTYSRMTNSSVNQVVVRSINTSVVTLLPVIAILLYGGDTLKDFAFALLVGIIPGAYSSIFLASPLLAIWKEAEPRFVALRRRVEAIERGEESPRFKRKKAAAGKNAEAEAADVAAGAAEAQAAGEGEASPATKPEDGTKGDTRTGVKAGSKAGPGKGGAGPGKKRKKRR